MSLQQIGFDDWFREKQTDDSGLALQPARVLSVARNSYTVSDGERSFTAELTGKMMFNAETPLDMPAVGDWLYVQEFPGQDLAVIHGIFPRKNLLKRKTAGKRVELQLIAANLDAALIVQALDNDFNLRRLERYLVMVRDSDIVPVVLLSKSDLVPDDEIQSKKAEIHALMPEIVVVAFNCIENAGLDEIERELSPGKTYCLLGSSGVGKSTLINRLSGNENLKTREVREDGRGRHTTTHRQLIVMDNGSMIIDTPGMRELGNLDMEAGIEVTFPDIEDLATQCRYSNCSHTHEDNCAVQAAIGDGSLAEKRFASYIKLRKETEHNQRSYRERRQKDKNFGKYVKSVMKDKKRERKY